ncbi:MAG TPA: hypothetical protein VGK00_10985 [Anaerolineales bacterium]|jgi:hypothetical protein
MKKIRENPSFFTGYVKLYLDDIISIIDSMQEINKGGELKITVGGYEFSSIDKISELKQKEHKSIGIEIRTSTPYSRFSLSVTKKNTFLSCSPNDDFLAYQGAFSNIKRIILARRRKWEWVEMFFYVSTSVGASISIITLIGMLNNLPLIVYIGYGIFGLIFIASLLYLFTIPVRVSKIILIDKIDEDTFWKRNKDKILISAISSILSFLLGILGTLFVQSISK